MDPTGAPGPVDPAPVGEFGIQITSAPVVAKARTLKVRDWGRKVVRENISVVDRIGAMGRGEPDPGEFRETVVADPEKDLRDLWNTDVEADLVEEAVAEIDKLTDEELAKLPRKPRRKTKK